jgi:hypothetical protein
MIEGIYILTIIYAIYVVDVAEGARIVVMIRDTLNIDLVQVHQKYQQFRDSGIKVIASVLPVNFISAA